MSLALYLGLLLALAWPLGVYMAKVFQGEIRFLAPAERLCYRLAGVRADDEQTWQRYAESALFFSLAGTLLLYGLLRLQCLLPGNPEGHIGVAPGLALNTAVSFVTNTNWQAYAGETTLSWLTQTLGLTVQNFLSAATGMAVLVALARGFARRKSPTIGCFFVDLTRATLYILLPLSLLFALFLVSQGVVQTYASRAVASLSDGTEQLIALGPVASQIAIKQLGTNGGGFFNANAAHPFENPTPLSNLAEVLAILLIPAALCFTFGRLIQDRRQGRALLATMLVLFIPAVLATQAAEQAGNPRLTPLGVTQAESALQSGGNLEGKEVRFGARDSALFAVATTAASNGSVNALHDSFTPLGGLVPLALIQLGEVVFGGVGSGLYGLITYALVAVFLAGLMVGRTPEYLGKKLEAFEIKMAALVLLVPVAATLVGTAIAAVVPAGTATLGNPGAHGFTELLYAFSSAANNNGSAFAGLDASTDFFTWGLSVVLWLGRFLVMVPILAIAGALAAKNTVPPSAGTLPTHTPLFVVLLTGTVLLVGALTFIPSLALGPIAEQLTLGGEP